MQDFSKLVMKLTVKQESQEAILVQIDLEGTTASPSDLAELTFPQISGGKGLIISGFPQWAAIAVAAYYKNMFKWIGVIDPKVNPEDLSAVVTFSLSPYSIGDVISLSELGLS